MLSLDDNAEVALMILKRSPARLSIALKRKRAGWEPDYVAELLARGFRCARPG
jgi:hypothetical protein